MFFPPILPRTIFEEIGKIVVLWATIEQDIILHTSAMAAQKTGGKTTDYLRLDFKRLREMWFGLCREYFDTKTFNKIVNPLNVELARLSTERGNVVHGMWGATGRGKFKLVCYEQKGQLVSYENDVTLFQVRGITHDSYLLSKRVHRFTSGQDGGGNGTRSVLKVAEPIVP